MLQSVNINIREHSYVNFFSFEFKYQKSMKFNFEYYNKEDCAKSGISVALKKMKLSIFYVKKKLYEQFYFIFLFRCSILDFKFRTRDPWKRKKIFNYFLI